MAWEYVNCAECGNEYRVQMYGPTKTRKWKIENWNGLCDDCNDAIKIALVEENKSGKMPELTGSDKQIAWAIKIREQKLSEYKKYTSERLLSKLQAELNCKYSNASEEEIDSLKKNIEANIGNSNHDVFFEMIAEQVFFETYAHKWIDNRDHRINDSIIKTAIDFLITDSPSDIEKELQASVEAEAVMAPKETVSETVADIRLTDNEVKISFKEKNEDFKEIVKSYGYLWASQWTKRLSYATEGAEDRVAEIGHALLSAGFKIRVMNHDIHEKIITGNFYPEHTRWISVLTKEPDIFYIHWSRGDDMYSEAKKIAGSRYSRPGVTVHMEHVDEVLDFAEIYKFKFSPAAHKLIDLAKANKAASLIVAVAWKEKLDLLIAQSGIQKLVVPELTEVDDELKD